MSGADPLAIGAEVLYREADLLDHWEWDAWVAMYTEDCEFWCPSWISETEVGTDPMKTLSHFYLTSREALDDRVYRIRSGVAPIAIPLPRTCHVISNVYLNEQANDRLVLSSHWQCHTYSHKVSTQVYGFYEHELVRQGGQDQSGRDDAWLIARKKITLLNDHLESPVDVNNV